MDKGGEYSLKWNSHKSTVMSAFTCLFENEKHADCTLAAEGKTIKAHKVMMSACSPYLEKLLEDYSKDKNAHPIVIFNDMRYFELKALCEYMYKGEVNIPKENLDSFLKIAKCMQVRGLCDGGGGESIGGKDSIAAVKSSPAHFSADKRKQQIDNKSHQGTSIQQQPQLKRKRQEGFDSDTSTDGGISYVSSPRGRGKQVKQAKVVATCQPRVVQEVKPEVFKEEPETIYEETVYQDLTYEEEIYQDQSNEAGTSAGESTIEFGNWNDGNSNDFNVQDSANQDQGIISEIISVPPRKRHKCRDCGRSYKLPTSLFNHRKYECGKGASFVCVECPMMFKRPENLKRHINVKHNPQPVVYMCRICGNLYKTKGNLKTHMINSHNAIESAPSISTNIIVETLKQEVEEEQ